MFISKKKLNQMLNEEKAKLDAEWEKRWQEADERRWQNESVNDMRREMRESIEFLSKRIVALEKAAGLYEEKKTCPFEVKTASY